VDIYIRKKHTVQSSRERTSNAKEIQA